MEFEAGGRLGAAWMRAPRCCSVLSRSRSWRGRPGVAAQQDQPLGHQRALSPEKGREAEPREGSARHRESQPRSHTAPSSVLSTSFFVA